MGKIAKMQEKKVFSLAATGTPCLIKDVAAVDARTGGPARRYAQHVEPPDIFAAQCTSGPTINSTKAEQAS